MTQEIKVKEYCYYLGHAVSNGKQFIAVWIAAFVAGEDINNREAIRMYCLIIGS